MMQNPPGARISMLGTIAQFARQARRPALVAVAIAALSLPVTITPSLARGPDGIADVAEQVIDSVVNISSSQNVEAHNVAPPQLPNDPQLDELFRDFFNRRQGQGDQNRQQAPRRVSSLGSGFIIDPSGIVVTNNHVIADADEITVILNDGTRLKAQLLGKDTKVDLAVLKVTTDRPLKAVKFGDSDRLRLGQWVIAIGNPFSLGGTVTAGIVSARNRDINSGPYDNYIQTDAAINRGNSGGPLFNLEGEVIGINTAIISPSGGSIGIGFSVPANTAVPVIDQLKQFGETRRGWLGVRIQLVTDEIAESLNIKPPHGALVAGIDDKGPAKPAGIEAGDVIVKFDGHEIKEMRDLPRVVADTAVGKAVEVIIIRKGQEETRTVTLGRLEDGEKQIAEAKPEAQPEQKPVVKRALGLDLANLDAAQRSKYKIKDGVEGVVIVGIDPNSPAGTKSLSAGDVVVEVQGEAVTSPDALQSRLDQMKRDGRKFVTLLITKPDGNTQMVALSLE
jgi:serine protease Do